MTASPPRAPLAIEAPLWILATLACGALLYESATISLWLVCSFFLFAMLDPMIQRLDRKGLSPVVSASLLIALATLLLVAVGAVIYHFSDGLAEVLQSYRKTLSQLYRSGSHALGRQVPELAPSPAAPPAESGGAKIAASVGAAFAGIGYIFLCPILTFFIIAERKTLAGAIAKLFGDGTTAKRVWTQMTLAVRAYFFGNLVLGLVCFPVFCIVFKLFKVETAYGLAALASLLNLIPFLGAILSGIIPALDLVSQDPGNIGLAAGLMASCLGIHFTVANLITPKLLGSKVDLNATTSTVVLIVWGELWGALGLLLAIPITACVKILCESSESPRLRWFASLMSEGKKPSARV
jgi:predicted PurR-regulated permease PerM